jgi:hypothetical protein
MKQYYVLPFILLAACSTSLDVSQTTEAPSNQAVAHPVQIMNGVLISEGAVPLNGVAEFMYKPEFNTSILKITLNIEPKDSINYQAWLKNPSNNEWLSAGALRNPGNNARFTSSAELAVDARQFTEVLVTEQPVGTESRDTIVARATLKSVVIPGS